MRRKHKRLTSYEEAAVERQRIEALVGKKCRFHFATASEHDHALFPSKATSLCYNFPTAQSWRMCRCGTWWMIVGIGSGESVRLRRRLGWRE